MPSEEIDYEPVKRDWIRRIAPGKTFADIGGLGGASVNEMVSTALRAGAASAAMVDVAPLGHQLWHNFESRCARLGVTGYTTLSADLEGPPLGPYEVVHCSGVIYHAANPVHQMRRLRQCCSEWLVFTSMIVPRSFEGVDLGDGGTIFVPALRGATRAAVARHFDSLGIRIGGINLDFPMQWVLENGKYNYSHWWWLFTADVVGALLGMAGFTVVECQETWPGRAVSWLCRTQPG